MAVLAVTGGTGFVGARLIALARAAGHQVRALARRPQSDASGLTWISGDLSTPDALRRLCDGADAVIHIAGVINARDRAGFFAGNADGTAAMLAAARHSGVARFVHTSSLAAREPELSVYGASKAEAEGHVASSPLDWTMIRPPAVYGPGDRETLTLFRMAARGLVLVPATGKASYIHVDDLCAALIAAAVGPHRPGLFEIDDGSGGIAHAAIARLLGQAVGRQALCVGAPGWLMLAAAGVATLLARLAGAQPKLSLDRARYFAHPDWAAHGPPLPGWQPQISTAAGFAATAEWYRNAGWL